MKFDLITWLSERTVNTIKDKDIINELFEERHYILIQKWIKIFRNKDVVVNQHHILQICENGAMAFYGELFKYLIVLSLAWYLNMFWSTFFIMNVFATLRGLAGGIHMSSFNKCFVVMIVTFLSLGYLNTHIHISNIVLAVCYLFSILSALKYAPQERPDKSDRDRDNGNQKKYMAVGYIIISFVLSVLLNNVIGISITLGVTLEIFTVTPIGTKIFKWLDGVEVSK